MTPKLKNTGDNLLPVPRGHNGWKTKVALCEAIGKAVTYKSGTTLFAETVDDVIQELEKRGHLYFESNAEPIRAGVDSETN